MKIKKDKGYMQEWDIKQLTPFLENIKDKEFIINKSKLKDYINQNNIFELENCDTFNIKKINDFIDKLPEKLIIDDNFYFNEEDDDIDESTFNDDTEVIKTNLEEYKEIAEIFADAFENRLRKVLKEIMKK